MKLLFSSPLTQFCFLLQLSIPPSVFNPLNAANLLKTSLAKLINWSAIIAPIILAGCSTLTPLHWSESAMNDETRAHPATQQFILFSKAAKKTENANDLGENFYTEHASKQLTALRGWHRLVYSANHYILKSMDCENFELTRQSRTSVKIDCIGTYAAYSPILGHTTERAHLRSFMKLRNDNVWRFDKSGYAHTQTFEDTVSVRRGGIKFPNQNLDPTSNTN